MPSKHVSAGQLIRRGLYDDLHSFAELEQRISALGDENTKAIGDAFEIFVEGYLATHQKMQAENVWLVGHVPPEIRHQLNLPSDAKGIDGVFRTRTGALVPYQVKFRSQRAYLTYTEIAPFLGLTERATDRIVFTNSNELAEDVKNRDATRTVRGIDFDDLTEDDLKAVNCWLREQPVAIPKFSPRAPDQIEALKRIGETLVTSDRAHAVMACGTGKTLVALWAAEALRPKTVLVLLPSLTLLQQTLDEWSRHNSWGRDFAYLCVCSDPTVVAKDANDPIHLDATDLDFRVDTSPDEVRRFIETGTTGIKVVFSTYHSSPVVSQGVQGLGPFDLAIFDEAHKTAREQGSLFAHSLSDENVRIRKRLFFTATPRHYDIRHRTREGDFRLASMDNEAIYGPRAYTLTFGSAVRQGIICTYKVIISVVDSQEINDFALKHGITVVEGALIRARWVANQIAVERAIEKSRAKRAITFHSRVSSAEKFSSLGSHGIQQFLPEFSLFHVNGDQKSSERKQLLRSFRDAAKALVTNARCLTEGIDVPDVDMVAFIDPRHSRIDIAQATGRAMRKPRGSEKQVGYIVIPLFLERESGETFEEALKRSDFSDIANVLNAMQEQDEDLVQIIREMQEAKGRGELFDPKRLSERIEVIGPAIELSALKSNIFAEVVNRIGVSWDEMYGRLVAYRRQCGHVNVPDDRSKLANWVSNQRAFRRRGILKAERIDRLNAIGFDWDLLATAWELNFQKLVKFTRKHGHANVPKIFAGDKQLGIWVPKQRELKKKGALEPDRITRLEEIGFDWDPIGSTWKQNIQRLIAFKKAHGTTNVLRSYTDKVLTSWVTSVRARKKRGKLEPERTSELEGIGFIWDPKNAAWEKNFQNLVAFQKLRGHTNVPATHGDKQLKNWVQVQRVFFKKKQITSDRIERLNAIGFQWDPFSSAWDKNFAKLLAFKELHGHTNVPSTYADKQLKNWVILQRWNRREGTLSPDRVKLLEEIGFVWDVLLRKSVRRSVAAQELEG
jgi:superfamily II DNA or RNA helicase